MRADRLVAILLLLQSRGQVTAPEVAAELEVSERTARRDLEALGLAGLPVYSQPGRGGGWRLAGGGRIDLSGLTAPETRALFLMAGPAAVTPEIKAALRKVVRALPEAFRDQAEAASGAVVVDPVGWGRNAAGPVTTPAHLDAIQQAVIAGRQVVLGYRARDRAETTRLIHPLGLAAKGPAWYLVAHTEGGMRTFRVDRMISVVVTDVPVTRPSGFDLSAAWRLVTEEVDQRRAPFAARALATPGIVHTCRWVLGTRLRIGPVEPDGRVALELRGASASVLAAEIAGFGALIEVVDPAEVRIELARIGRQLVERYGVDGDLDRAGGDLSGAHGDAHRSDEQGRPAPPPVAPTTVTPPNPGW